MLVVGGDTTAHEVRQRARCNNCGVKGNNTYQIVYTGNSSGWRLRLLDIALDGAGVRPAKSDHMDSRQCPTRQSLSPNKSNRIMCGRRVW